MKVTSFLINLMAVFQTILSNPVLNCRPMNVPDAVRRREYAQLLYPNMAAFAVQSFEVTPTDVSGSRGCPYEDRAWQYSSPDACPYGVAPNNTVIDNKDASCPWTYIDCVDINRIPMTIKMAQCQCADCLDPYTNSPDPNLRCQPITYNMKVLQRAQCLNGLYRYVEEIIEVPVACACMRQRH